MAENLHLVLNERVHEGRVYNLKRTNMEDKQWVCRRIEKGCRGSIHTYLFVDAVLHSNPHADDCTLTKKNALKRRAAEEMKTDPQTYHEEASSASADLETAVLKRQSTGNLRRNFRDFRQQLEIPPRWRMTKSDRQENLSILSEHSVWFMDGTFKIVPEWYQQMFTIHVFIA
ncbi:hypothetical protein T06_7013, partial [Trichinella sp. T6]